MIKHLIQKPVGVLTATLGVLILGFICYFSLPTSLLPPIENPKIVIFSECQNYSSLEMESKIAKPIRDQLGSLTKLNEISSVSRTGQTEVSIEFKYGTDLSLKFLEVNERLDMLLSRFPKTIKRPIVIKNNPSNIPIFQLNVVPNKNLPASKFTEISNFVEKVLIRRIEQIPEIAMVDVTGLSRRSINIQPKYNLLRSLGVEYDILFDAIGSKLITFGDVNVKNGNFEYLLKSSKEEISKLNIENTVVSIGSRIFKLSDLADVSEFEESNHGRFISNGIRSFNLSVLKQPDGKISDLEEKLEVLLSTLKVEYPDIEIFKSQDQLKLLKYSISNLWQDLILGGVFAVVVMLIFVRKVKSAILIALSIPSSLIISQLLFYVFNLSINIISLGGLILGLGMVIDNSIVVIDSINEFTNRNLIARNAAADGVASIIRPLITSILTNCAVFLPLILIGGIAGAIFYDQALSVIIGVCSSLFVSVFLLPVLFTVIYKSKTDFVLPSYINFTKFYDKTLSFSFRRPFVIIGIVLSIIICGFIAFKHLPKQKFPKITKKGIEITIDWNEMISVDESTKRLNLVCANARNLVNQIDFWVGEQQYVLSRNVVKSTECKIYVKSENLNKLQDACRLIGINATSNFPRAVVRSEYQKNTFDYIFPDDKYQVLLKIQNKHDLQLPEVKVSSSVIRYLQESYDYNFDKVRTERTAYLHLDFERMAHYGVSKVLIERELVDAFGERNIESDTQGAKVVNVAELDKLSLREIIDGKYLTIDNSPVNLGQFIKLTFSDEYAEITSGIKGPYFQIGINSEQNSFSVSKLSSRITKEFPDLNIEYAGSLLKNDQLIIEMIKVLAISIILLYFILASQFESFVQPLFVLLELPIAFSGSLITLYLAGDTINLMSMIGIIVMSGLIINDSILKIDAINQYRKNGFDVKQAIYRGGHQRLKPIIMISLVSIGTLLPTIIMSDIGSELQRPLALTLIGGMFFGMFVSLFFLPLVYSYVYKK